MLGYVRIMTNRSAVARPIAPADALRDVRSWLELPHVVVLAPGARHLDIVEHLFEASGATGRLATDVHLAALAIEHQAELHSCDSDFSRFPGLRRRDPLR
jgi:toxin-antitoxin system PIN domain toxin